MKSVILLRGKNLFAVASAMTIGLCGTAVAKPALAMDRPVVVVANPDIVTRRIGYADLNLASYAGERILSQRLSGAIKSLCLEATGDDGRFWPSPYVDCRSSAWGQARPQMAKAAQRARDIALTGTSTIAAVAITIDLAK